MLCIYIYVLLEILSLQFTYFSLFKRTLVECSGLCLSHPSCGAFHWDSTTCTALNKELLYADKTTQVDTYIQQPNGPGKLQLNSGLGGFQKLLTQPNFIQAQQ